MEIRKVTKYLLQVRHPGSEVEDDMNFDTKNPKIAYQRLQYLKEKYKGMYINITKKTETTTFKDLSESDLEKLANSNK